MRKRSFSIPQGILLMAVAMATLLATACGSAQHPNPQAAADPGYNADALFTLKTGMNGGRLVFIGIGGEVDGVVNPTLRVNQGNRVKIVLVNGDGAVHDIALPGQGMLSAEVSRYGEEATVTFTDEQDGEFVYYCTVPGHRQAGMEGKLVAG